MNMKRLIKKNNAPLEDIIDGWLTAYLSTEFLALAGVVFHLSKFANSVVSVVFLMKPA